MALKKTVTSLEEVPEAYRGAYQQIGDVYVLELEGDDTSTRLGEFRDNNIALLKDKKTLEEQLASFSGFDGINADEARAALDTLQKQKDEKMISEGRLEELLGQRTETMRSKLGGQLEALQLHLDKQTARGDMFEQRYTSTVIDSQIQNAVTEVAAVRPGAMTDILSRARGVWSVGEDGNLIPMRDGKVMYGESGKDPLTMNEYATTLYHDATYLFEPNSGGGASGNRDGAANTGSTIDRSDQGSINDNLVAIAAGEVQVI